MKSPLDTVTTISNDPGRVMFFCPGCDTHHAISTLQGMWTWNGDRVKPTFKPSVLSNARRSCPDLPRCHIFVTDGKIKFLDDCTHALAGKTVDLPVLDRT